MVIVTAIVACHCHRHCDTMSGMMCTVHTHTTHTIAICSHSASSLGAGVYVLCVPTGTRHWKKALIVIEAPIRSTDVTSLMLLC